MRGARGAECCTAAQTRRNAPTEAGALGVRLSLVRYEVEDVTTGEVLSQHRTRQGAIDGWRTRHSGRPIRVVRLRADGQRTVVVEGTWHADRK